MTKSMAKKSTTGSLPPAVPLAITPTFSPWTHTSDNSYIYQLSLVLATATVSFGDCISARTCNRIIVGGSRMWRCTYYARTAVRIHPFGASMFIYQVQFMGTLHVRTPNKEASKRLGLFVLCRHKCWLLYYHALVFARVYRNFDSCIHGEK